MSDNKTNLSVVTRQFLLPFILVTACFALWGFANDITNPMVKAFSKIFRMNVTQGTLVQVAFYGGYFAMAVPAALFIRRFSYKSGILMGLALYAIGGLLFFPAKMTGNYYPFLIAYFILTCGLSFLETSANPFILSMGDERTATRRLNFAQSFNPMGSILGMFTAMFFIQRRINPMPTEERALLSESDFEAMKQADLSVLIKPYLLIALVIVVMFVALYLVKIPATAADRAKNDPDNSNLASFKRLMKNKRYLWSVVAQFFYVGAQIMCWTFIIHYGTHYLVLKGMGEQDAEARSQVLNMVAMGSFITFRFVCTYLMKYIQPAKLLALFAGIATLLTLGVIGFTNGYGLCCLVLVSAFMSLMFPTIYGIGLDGIGRDAEFGAAGLIMAILGGSVLPPLQSAIIDKGVIFGSFPAVNASFVLPLICFVVVGLFGLTMVKKETR